MNVACRLMRPAQTTIATISVAHKVSSVEIEAGGRDSSPATRSLLSTTSMIKSMKADGFSRSGLLLRLAVMIGTSIVRIVLKSLLILKAAKNCKNYGKRDDNPIAATASSLNFSNVSRSFLSSKPTFPMTHRDIMNAI